MSIVAPECTSSKCVVDCAELAPAYPIRRCDRQSPSEAVLGCMRSERCAKDCRSIDAIRGQHSCRPLAPITPTRYCSLIQRGNRPATSCLTVDTDSRAWRRPSSRVRHNRSAREHVRHYTDCARVCLRYQSAQWDIRGRRRTTADDSDIVSSDHGDTGMRRRSP